MLRASEDRASAVLRSSEQKRFSSARDDEAGGYMRAMREQLAKERCWHEAHPDCFR